MSGLKESDTKDVIQGALQREPGSDVGSYKISNNNLTAVNYTISVTSSVKFAINPKPITANMITLDSNNNCYDFTRETITPTVTVTDEDHTLVPTSDKDYVISGDTTKTNVGTYTLTITGKGNYTGETTVTWKITDPNPPTGAIQVGSNDSNKWNSFLNNITFGIFFKDTQTVKITGADGANESGLNKLYYHVSETELAKDQVSALEDSKWTEISNNGTFSIDPDKKLIIYAKITDKSKNTTYISSNGLVLDGTAPTISGVTADTKYCESQTITVSDNNLETVTVKVNGQEVTLSDGTYTLPATNTSYSIVATDKAGNAATVSGVTIYNGHSFTNYTSDNNASLLQNCTETASCDHGCGTTNTREIPNTKIKKPMDSTSKDSADVGTVGGKIETEVNVDQNAPKTEISNLNVELAKKLLSTEELQQVEDGTKILLYLDVINADNTAPTAGKNLVTGLISSQLSNGKVGMYLDLSLYKKVGENAASRLTDITGNMIEVAIEIPDQLKNTDPAITRTYHMIRVHNEVPEFLESTYNATTGILTTETDQFSTYAIAYTDTRNGNGGDSNTGQSSTNNSQSSTKAAKTGDNSNVTLWTLLLLAALAGVAGVFIYRKKEFNSKNK